MFEAAWAGLVAMAAPQSMFFLCVGVVYGIVIGIIPGL
ncbi:MAG: hypothetical protein KDK10_18985, partial [Maritimibacter sp.]|nr:hypothetical protein [Maritimibacter sp.]